MHFFLSRFNLVVVFSFAILTVPVFAAAACAESLKLDLVLGIYILTSRVLILGVCFPNYLFILCASSLHESCVWGVLRKLVPIYLFNYKGFYLSLFEGLPN